MCVAAAWGCIGCVDVELPPPSVNGDFYGPCYDEVRQTRCTGNEPFCTQIGVPAEADVCSASCGNPEDCPTPESAPDAEIVCVEGACAIGCTTDADCTIDGMVCIPDAVCPVQTLCMWPTQNYPDDGVGDGGVECETETGGP